MQRQVCQPLRFVPTWCLSNTYIFIDLGYGMNPCPQQYALVEILVENSNHIRRTVYSFNMLYLSFDFTFNCFVGGILKGFPSLILFMLTVSRFHD
jgi:hypothetical protein